MVLLQATRVATDWHRVILWRRALWPQERLLCLAQVRRLFILFSFLFFSMILLSFYGLRHTPRMTVYLYIVRKSEMIFTTCWALSKTWPSSNTRTPPRWPSDGNVACSRTLSIAFASLFINLNILTFSCRFSLLLLIAWVCIWLGICYIWTVWRIGRSTISPNTPSSLGWLPIIPPTSSVLNILICYEYHNTLIYYEFCFLPLFCEVENEKVSPDI